ncbi:MAG: glycoside hydrolase family 3 C-terminal domain-containing protein, partial [Bacteroidota bacterium]
DKELQAAVNDAVRRILRVKFLLGLFDDPYADPNSAEEVNRAQEHLDLSLEVAEETMVLLKNEKNILPLSKSDYKKIAVIGPHSNETHYGGYAHKDVSRGITIYQGLKDYLGDDVEVTTAQGCKIHGGSYHWLGFDDFELANPEENRRMIEEAVKVAEDSELVILAVGGTAVETGEFIGYRNELGLFGSQKKLVAAIMALNKPTIITLINGRPYTIPDLHAQADAILEAWYPGEFAGVAIANTLYGENNPSGKLTLSFPRMIGDLPVYYSKKESSSTKDYLAEDTKALYPFGYGLSYTSFEYSDFEIDKSTISEGGQVQVSGILRNTGDRAGEEIVQYYIRDRYSSASRPIKELKGFRKVSLEPGESKSVSWTLSIDDLRFYDHQMNYVVEPGRFEIMVGASSEDIKFETSFTLE